MGNNGFGRDTLLIEKMIKNSKLLTINEDDSPTEKLIKIKLNVVIAQDVLTKHPYQANGWSGQKKHYIRHSAWDRKLNVVTVINKIRQQRWFWKYIPYK